MNSLDEMLDSDDAAVLAIEIDPRIEFNASKREIVSQRTAGSGLSDSDIADIVHSALASLRTLASAALRHRDVSKLDTALVAFDGDLSARIAEHQAEKRKHGSFANQIARAIALDEFRPHAFGRSETLALESLCRDGDQIVGVDFDGVTITRDGNQITFTRYDLIEATRPSTSSFESWRRAGGFVSDGKIKEDRESLEKAEYNAAHPDSGRSILHADGSTVRA